MFILIVTLNFYTVLDVWNYSVCYLIIRWIARVVIHIEGGAWGFPPPITEVEFPLPGSSCGSLNKDTT